MSEPLLKYEELAKETGLTRRHLELLVQRRAIPVLKLSRRCHRFKLSKVQAALDRLEVKALG